MLGLRPFDETRKSCLLVDKSRAIEYACEAASAKTEKVAKLPKILS
jgi:hypothetical protein